MLNKMFYHGAVKTTLCKQNNVQAMLNLTCAHTHTHTYVHTHARARVRAITKFINIHRSTHMHVYALTRIKTHSISHLYLLASMNAH